MMMNKLSPAAIWGLLLITLLFVAGCSKDKFASKPSLKFKSINSYDIPLGGLFEIRLEYTDAEGDLRTSDGSLDSGIVILRSIARCTSDSQLYKYKLPPGATGKNSSGEIVIRFENGTNNYSNAGYPTYTSSASCSFATARKVDTTNFRFYIKDLAGNTSDTVSIDKPVLIRK